jgi:peptidyl-prolyl cis-trans isomerase C
MPHRLKRLTLAAVAPILIWSAPALAQDEQGQAVAIVNGEEITDREIVDFFVTLPPEIQQRGLQMLFPGLLEEIIRRRVVLPQAIADGMADDPEIEARLAEIKQDLIYNTYVRRQAEERVSDDAVRASYDAWVAQQPVEEEVEASHVLVETEEEARAVIEQVTGGTPFADIARERSTGPSGPDGGYLGWLRPGQTVPAFNDAAFALQPNQFTADPVQTQFGWHVILVADRRMVEPPSYEELAPRFRRELAQTEAQAFLDDAVAEATVQRLDAEGNPLPAQ